jgi:hypothetical protein
MRILKWAWMMVLAFSVTVGYAQESSVPNLDKIGTIKKVYGDVKLVRQSVEARPVAGDPVLRGDKLITGVYSNVSVVMRDRTTLMLGSKSAVDLTKFDFDSTTQDGNLLVDLAKGTLRMVTGLIAKVNPAAVEVRTPTMSVGVRGTDFVVQTAQ